MRIIIISIISTLVLGGLIYFLYKKKKLTPVIEYLVSLLNVYGKNVINKVKLAILLNTVRSWVISKTNNLVIKFIIEFLWPEFDILNTALKISLQDNKKEAINSIPDMIVSKTVDEILNSTKYTNDFSTTTNLKITEKDRGYLEAYLEGQINKLEEAKIGLKGGIKF